MNLKVKVEKLVIAVVIIIPIIVIFGWIFNIEIFKTGWPGSHSTMKFNTAFCFLLAGISLAILQKQKLSKWQTRIYYLLIFLVILITLLTLIQYVFNCNLGIDQMLFYDLNPYKTTIYPGRMSQVTALNFILISVALFLLRKKQLHKQWLAQILAIAVMLIVFLPLLGNLAGVNIAYQLVKHIASTAIHTSINFIFLGIGILLTSKNYGFMKIITSDMIGGEMIRGILPWAIAVPLILNGLIIYGHKLNWYDDSSSYAYFSVINISLVLALIYWNALKLNHIEQEKIAKLQEFNQVLENRVLARTIELEQVNNQLLFALQYRQEQAELIIEKEALLTSVLETTKDLFLAVDTKFNIIAFNHNYCREFKQNTGIDIEIGMNFMEALSVIPEDKKRVTPLWEKALKGEKFSILYDFHAVTIKKDYFFEFDFNPMWNQNGDLSGISQFVRDVTERVINEHKLQESEAKLQAIIDGAPAAIYAKDKQGKFILINRYCLDLFNWNKEECLGKTFLELLPEETIKKVENYDQQVWSTQTPLYLEEEIPISDEIHIHHTIKFLLYDFHGNPYALCGIST
ncbi:MAG TPA: PAS domain-containing protein, partial [Allocoleopsis sp.]